MTVAGSWDAVVVGAGIGGCVAAAELAETGRRVLVIEAGPGQPHPESVLGLDTIAAAEEQSRQWPMLGARSEAAGAERPYRQGYGVGGGSLINSLLLSPGDSRDYRRWEEQFGCIGWGPNDMAPFLELAADRFVGSRHQPGPVSQAFADAAAAAGHALGGSSLDQDRLGVLETRLAAANGRRVSVIEAYLDQAVDGQITVWAGRQVRRVMIRDHRAVGVEMHDGGVERAPIVIVAAGAIRSPLLLIESGVAAPGLGRGLKDHPSFAFTLALKPDAVLVEAAGRHDDVNIASRLLRWSSGRAEQGDLQAFAIDRVGLSEGQRSKQAYAAVVVGLMRVTSSGTVAAAASGPRVVTGALGTDSDRERLRAGVQQTLELLRSEEFSPLIDEIYLDADGTPASAMAAMDGSTLDRFLGRHPGPYAHLAGTCAMGPAGGAATVVSCDQDTAGQVVGTEGLYVADASIMPDLVQGGLQVPVAAIAARVAQAITRNF